MSAYNISNRRELFIDDHLIDVVRTTAKEQLHHPVQRELVMTNDAPWEADGWVYYSVVQDGNLYRMYYLSMPMYNQEHTKHDPPFHHINYAESNDGIHWMKPDLYLHEFNGSKKNNILMITDTMDAFSVFIDKNPNCPKEERYKAIYTKPHRKLWCMTSSDGIHFADGWLLSENGLFDSQNTAFWDPNIKQYVCYCRNFHEGKDGKQIRDIRRMVSDDFRNWTFPVRITYENSPYDFHMYTNGVQPYFRAPEIYVAFPARYVERTEWMTNYDRLCGAEHRKWRMQFNPRYGLAVTDGLFMSSRDGESFRRWDEAFIRPGAESAKRWVYGDGYAAYGLVPTKGRLRDEDDELSFYASANCWSDTPVQVYRHTLRMDGFVSRSAGYEGGEVVTKPLIFKGKSLSINFATSAAGSIRIAIENEDGAPINGYNSGELFGDSTDRIVDFEKSLEELNGIAVRLHIWLKDADVYSFKFLEEVL